MNENWSENSSETNTGDVKVVPEFGSVVVLVIGVTALFAVLRRKRGEGVN